MGASTVRVPQVLRTWGRDYDCDAHAPLKHTPTIPPVPTCIGTGRPVRGLELALFHPGLTGTGVIDIDGDVSGSVQVWNDCAGDIEIGGDITRGAVTSALVVLAYDEVNAGQAT